GHRRVPPSTSPPTAGSCRTARARSTAPSTRSPLTPLAISLNPSSVALVPPLGKPRTRTTCPAIRAAAASTSITDDNLSTRLQLSSPNATPCQPMNWDSPQRSDFLSGFPVLVDDDALRISASLRLIDMKLTVQTFLT